MTTPATDDDMTDMSELVDATFPRVDLVGKGANGVPRFLIAKEADGGLLDAAFVRSLISKSDPGAGSEEQVTVSGSPAAIARMIHQAAQKPVAKAELHGSERSNLPDSAFAYIEPGGHKEDGKTKPDKLRHFPIHDEKHVRNALSQAPKSEFGDKAMPKIRAAAKKYGIDVSKALADAGVAPEEIAKMLAEPVAKDIGPDLDDSPDQMDSMDVTVPLAAPDQDAPGDPADPGSPAWEAIDAATACKWTSILSRARVAIDLLAEREMLESASADPDDIENAWDLQDVCCAIDYAISVLAPFAVAEQSEADCGADAMAVSKAMAGFDGVPMDQIEALAQVAKAGRVLSSANEGLIRDAAGKLQSVLASLPAAPQADDSGLPVAKQQEEPVTATAAEPVAKEGERTPEQQAAASAPVSAGGTTGMGQPRDAGPAAALPGDGPQAAMPGDVPGRQVVKGAAVLRVGVYDHRRRLAGLVDPSAISLVAKADDGSSDGDGKTMQAVFDQNGDLIGIVDPADITPVSGAGKKPGKDDGDMPDGKDGTDLTPQPSGDAGTPADQVGKQAGTETTSNDNDGTVAREVLKGIVLEAMAEANAGRDTAEVVSKADHAALLEEVGVLKARLATVEETEARPKTFASGQVPPPGQLRGQDHGAPPVDVAKAADLRAQLYHGSGPEQKAAADEMTGMAVRQLAAIHAGKR